MRHRKPTSDDHAEPSAFRFSIAGMMLLTAVVAAHLAIGRWEISVMAAIAPLTLSVAAIEALRRLFRVGFMTSLVGGILLGAVLYSLTIGIVVFWDRWLLYREPEMVLAGRLPSVWRILYQTARHEVYGFLVWYLTVGMLVMLGYAAFVIVRDRRAARRIRSQAGQRRAALTNPDKTSSDA